MKKTILFFALSTAILSAQAQITPVVDAHAGHNHAKTEVAATVAPTTVLTPTTKKAKADAKKAASNKKAGVAFTAPTVALTPTTSPTLATAVEVAPDALAVKETEYDFGKIPQGKPVTHVFTVTNIGKAAYKLDNVQASCGCTTPEWDREKMIEAGANANITVGFNAGAPGPFTKPVTITYNGTQTKVINIKGEVYATPATPAPANAEILEIKK